MKKENSDAKTTSKQASKENPPEFPSMLSDLPQIQQKKRTVVRRKKLQEIIDGLLRLPKNIDEKPDNELTHHSNDENKPKRQRGRPLKHQVAAASSSPNPGVDQSNDTKHTSLNKNEPKQLQSPSQPRPLLRPQPQPWLTDAPFWLQSDPPFMNIGSSSKNGTDFKGKEVMVDEGKQVNYGYPLDLEFMLGNPKGGVKIRDRSNENAASATEKGRLSHLSHEFTKVQVQEPAQAVPKRGLAAHDPPHLQLQECAEALYGKEAFSKGEPPVMGLQTALLSAVQNHPNYQGSDDWSIPLSVIPLALSYTTQLSGPQRPQMTPGAVEGTFDKPRRSKRVPVKNRKYLD